MTRLYLSLPKAEREDAHSGTFLLVGQRCGVTPASDSAPPSVGTIVVAERVVCEDVDVVEEQMECLERVLPFGIEVVGIWGDAEAVRHAAAQLRDDTARELVGVVCGGGSAAALSGHLLSAPSSFVEVLCGEAVEFVEARAALHTCEVHLPLLVSVQGEAPVIVDGESRTPLKAAAPLVTSGAQITQLGTSKSLLRLHVVVAPAHASATDLYATLRRQLSAALAAGTTRLVEVQSHNAHVSYCCRVEAAASTRSDDLSEKTLAEVFEMIEDATGTARKPADVRKSPTALQAPRQGTAASKKKEKGSRASASASAERAATKGAGRDTLLLVVGAAVLIVAVLLILMRR